MTSVFATYAAKFNAFSLRERLLLGSLVLVGLTFSWWHFHVQPMVKVVNLQKLENQRITAEVTTTRAAITQIRNRIAAGVHKEKEQRLVQLQAKLKEIEESLRLKTIKLIDPEDMFNLMSQMIYRESRLKLINLKRLDVRPAIPVEANENSKDAGIFRHVLEIKFSGKYADILSYMQSLEARDWVLIWDEIEIVSEEYPQIIVKLHISTLSTREEWVGV